MTEEYDTVQVFVIYCFKCSRCIVNVGEMCVMTVDSVVPVFFFYGRRLAKMRG